MSTHIGGDFGITHVYLESRVRLIAGAMSCALTVAWETGSIWRYTLSVVSDTARNSRAGVRPGPGSRPPGGDAGACGGTSRRGIRTRQRRARAIRRPGTR